MVHCVHVCKFHQKMRISVTNTHWFAEFVRSDTAESLSLKAVLTSETAVLQLSR